MSINFEFDICPQARAVQAALGCYREQPEFDDLYVQAWPRFNGREHGICLVVTRIADSSSSRLLISFGENRNSDDLFVQSATTGRVMMNGPELSDFDEARRATRLAPTSPSCTCAKPSTRSSR